MQNPFATPANQNQRPISGKLAENIMHFARVLREAGIPVGPGAVLDALDAAQCGSLRTRDDFYWTLHAVFVKRRDQREVFDQAFEPIDGRRDAVLTRQPVGDLSCGRRQRDSLSQSFGERCAAQPAKGCGSDPHCV